MLLKIIYRTVILYLFIVVCYRIMGKKEVGELSIIDLIVSFSISDLAAISIEETDKTIFSSIIPITILVLLEIILSYLTMKSDKIKTLADGNAEVIVDKGKINVGMMKKLRYNLDDLLTQLRKKDIYSLKDVYYAILETDGTLSVSKNVYPLPLIMEGKIDKKTLKNIHKDTNWLYQILKNYNVQLKDVYYAFYDNGKTYIIENKDLIK